METVIEYSNDLRRSLMQAIFGGIIGTLPMSVIMYTSPAFGWPAWPVPDVLADMLHTAMWIGWLAHFAIGMVFAVIYLFTLNRIKLRSRLLRGALYGLAAYAVAVGSWIILRETNLVYIRSLVPLTYPYLIEHIVFAVTMATFVPDWRPYDDNWKY